VEAPDSDRVPAAAGANRRLGRMGFARAGAGLRRLVDRVRVGLRFGPSWAVGPKQLRPSARIKGAKMNFRMLGHEEEMGCWLRLCR
jgi:hypothetical protein